MGIKIRSQRCTDKNMTTKMCIPCNWSHQRKNVMAMLAAIKKSLRNTAKEITKKSTLNCLVCYFFTMKSFCPSLVNFHEDKTKLFKFKNLYPQTVPQWWLKKKLITLLKHLRKWRFKMSSLQYFKKKFKVKNNNWKSIIFYVQYDGFLNVIMTLLINFFI